MIATVNDIKGAFIAMCAKMAGMPVGRTSFQDFEIAFLINTSYEKCLKSRLDSLQHMNNTYGEGHKAHRDHSFGRTLSELGTLYAPATTDIELNNTEVGLADAARLKMWGANSRMFEIPPVNGYFPYIIGADLFEFMPKLKNFVTKDMWDTYVKAKVNVREENLLQQRNISWPVRILSGSEILDYAHLLQNGANYIDELPYRIGRVRTYQVESPTRLLTTLKNDILEGVTGALSAIMGGTSADDEELKTIRATWHFEQLYILEILHPRHFTDAPSEIKMTIERVMHPRPVTEKEIKEESKRTVEVSFGYEIAETAAQIGMEALASGTKLPPPNAQPQK